MKKTLFTFLIIASTFTMRAKAQSPTRKTIVSDKVTSQITIDGNLNESSWNLKNSLNNQIDITNANCDGTISPGSNNNKVTFDAQWDDEYLYVGVKVLDDVLVPSDGNSDFRDGVNLYLAMDNQRTTNCPANWPRAYGSNDYQITYNYGGGITSPQAMELAVSEFKKLDIPGGYSLELKLSWMELDFFSGLSVSEGRTIGFDISNEDSDEIGKSWQGQLMWNQCCTNRNWTENLNFGDLELGKPNNDTVSTPSFKNVTASKADSIIIDGNLNEAAWNLNNNLTNQIELGNFDCGNISQGPFGNNNKVVFGTLWNENNLYIGVKVYDSLVVKGEDDGIELFFNMDNVRSSNCPGNWPRAYGPNDFHLIVGTDGNITSPQGMELAVKEFQITYFQGGYSIELALSWEEMDFFSGLTPSKGRVFGFDIANNDTDIDGQKRQGQLMWNQCCSNRNWTENFNFGYLTLGGSTDSCLSSTPIVQDVKVCSSDTVRLKASGNGIIKWYNSITGSTPVNEGNEYVIPYLVSTTTFYVTNTVGNCESTRIPITATIENSFIDTLFWVNGDTLSCQGSNSVYWINDYYSQNKNNYEWKVSDGGVIASSNIGKQITVIWKEIGEKKVIVTPFNSCSKGNPIEISVKVGSFPETPSEIVGPTTVCPGSYKYEVNKVPGVTYYWFTSGGYVYSSQNTAEVRFYYSGTQNINVYTYNQCGMSKTQSLAVNVRSFAPTPSICKVTADEITGKNLIIFNKPFETSNIESYRIYREGNVANKFNQIGVISKNSINSFIDETSKPNQQAYTYTIAVRDSCENVSTYGQAHKTIHLTINKGANSSTWNLIWTKYEGLFVPTYEIYRGTKLNQLAFLTSVSGNLSSYTDETAPSGKTIYYQIVVSSTPVCSFNRREEAGKGEGILSNIARFEESEENVDAETTAFVKVYPNPSNGTFNIEMLDKTAGAFVTLSNMMGEVVSKFSLENGNTNYTFNNLPVGIYVLEVSSEGKIERKKVVIEK